MEAYLSATLGECSGLSFVDSTRLSARISFFTETEVGRSKHLWGGSMGLHLIINEKGELLDVALTPGNTDDRKPLWGLSEGSLHGNLYGDRGYISKDLRERLRERGINLVYKVRKNMKPLDLSVSDEVLLRKRMLIESVQGSENLEHSRHRSSIFQVNVVSALSLFPECVHNFSKAMIYR